MIPQKSGDVKFFGVFSKKMLLFCVGFYVFCGMYVFDLILTLLKKQHYASPFGERYNAQLV